MGLTYCCCTSLGKLVDSCLGSTAAGTTGRKRSVLLLTIAIALSLWFQYSVGPGIVSKSGWIWQTYRFIPGMGKMVYHAWYDSCETYKADEHLVKQCAGFGGVYRPMFVATLFFILSAVATKVQPSLNREAWPAKYAMFLFAVALSMIVHTAPLFTGFYLWMARLGATVFVVLQQVILIDVAYNWNEDWVDRADQEDRLSYGEGSAWLKAIVATCVTFYALALAGIIVLYRMFDGCALNAWIITLTVVGIVALTVIQLSGSEGSLLTSSVISLYAVYLAYSAVSKNPDGSCNPQLGDDDVWGIAMGLTLTAVSLAWTGWSWTAEDRLNVEGVQSARTVAATNPDAHASDGRNVNLDVPFLDPDEQGAAGLVMDTNDMVAATFFTGSSEIWKLNVVMVLISCYVAMTLTGWGTIEVLDEEKNAANPTVGRVNMAMLMLSQWFAIGLYGWTLLAPRLFPDRDFS
jgi:serine incorporator 1/3